jgi:hypothetical protein
MTTIADGIAAVAAALNLAKELVGVNKAFGEAEFKLKIAELTTSLSTAKMALSDAQEELQKKEAENASLRKSFEFRGELIEIKGFKYRKGKERQAVGAPFCPRCEQNVGKFYQLTKRHKPGVPFACPNCDAEYTGVATFHYD